MNVASQLMTDRDTVSSMDGKTIPTSLELAALSDASIANARAYLKEASILLENEAWARAHSSATLALEEIGKAHLCVSLIWIPEQYRSGFPFWQAFRNHRTKLTFAYIMRAILGDDEPPSSLAGVLESASSAADADNTTKFRGLYVDYEDGALRVPAQVSEAEARAVIARVRLLLHGVGEPYSLSNLLSFISAEGEDRAVIAHMSSRFREMASDEDTFIANLRKELQAMRSGSFDFSSDA